MTRGDEQNQEQCGAVDTWPVNDVCQRNKRDDEERGGVGRDEKER